MVFFDTHGSLREEVAALEGSGSQGLRVVRAPVQLAAVLAGASIFEPEGWSRRPSC